MCHRTIRDGAKLTPTAAYCGTAMIVHFAWKENPFSHMPQSLKAAVLAYAEYNKIKHLFNKDEKEAGKDWLYGFLKRRQGSPNGSFYKCSKSGWMINKLFNIWLVHFTEHTKPSVDDSVLLMLDNRVVIFL